MIYFQIKNTLKNNQIDSISNNAGLDLSQVYFEIKLKINMIKLK